MEEKEKSKREQQELKEQQQREREAKQKAKQQQAEQRNKTKGIKQGLASTWTQAELELFQRHYDNGYDITTDAKYISWLTQNHPEEASTLCAKSTLLADDTFDSGGERSHDLQCLLEDSCTESDSDHTQVNRLKPKCHAVWIK